MLLAVLEPNKGHTHELHFVNNLKYIGWFESYKRRKNDFDSLLKT